MGLRLTALAMMVVGALGCGGTAAVLVESPPKVAPGQGFAPPAPPAERFLVPSPELGFVPVSIGSDLGQGLAAALAATESLAIVLPHGPSSAALEERVFSMVKAASPSTAVLTRGRATLDTLLEERGELPYRVTREPAGTDILGRPFFLPKEHPLQTEWLTQKKALKGARALLVVRPMRVDDQRLRQLRETHTGGCDQTLSALSAGVERADGYFAPYLQPVNDALASAFARHLQSSLPFFRSELEKAASDDGAPGTKACVDAYTALLEAFEPCAAGPCPLSPVAAAVDGGVVGFPHPAVFVPPSCPTAAMRDFQRELADIAQRATSEVLPNLDGPWVAELLRYSGLRVVHEALQGACAPRHRRFTEADLGAARKSVAQFLSELSTSELVGTWQPAAGQERIAGFGTVTVLAKVRPTGVDPRALSAQLASDLRRLEQCDKAPEQVYQAALVDVGTSEVVFLGLFFEEQLLCPGLPPG